MFTNGAPIGLTLIIIGYRRSEILKDQQAQWTARPPGPDTPRRLDVRREGVPGVISRKYRGVPRAPAFPQNFSMPITDFELPAMFATNERTSRPSQYFTIQKTCDDYGGLHALLYEHNAKGPAAA